MFNNLKHLLRALKYRNYRLFFFGQGISLVGTWMQQVTMGWLVYRLTHSIFYLGVVSFADKIPIFIFTTLAGVLVDRHKKFRIILIAQILSMIQAFVFAFLVLKGAIQPWHIVILAAILGMINSVEIPARQSFLIEMIEEKEDLGNAIALNSIIFHGARLIGPSIGGIMIGLIGEGYCFLINGISFLAVIVALLGMKLIPKEVKANSKHPWIELKEGFSYAFGFPPTLNIILLLSLFSLILMPYVVLLPAFAKNVLGGDSNTFGFLVAASGGGSVLGALYLASRKTVIGLERWTMMAAFLFAFVLTALSFTKILWFSLYLMFLGGFGIMVHVASSNTILQTIVDDDKRGRIMSIYAVAVIGLAPIGSLLIGAFASRFGIPLTIRITGLIGMTGSLVFASKLPAIKKLVHPIYTQMGLFEDTSSIRSAVDTVSKIETLEKS